MMRLTNVHALPRVYSVSAEMDWLVYAVIAAICFLWGLVKKATALNNFWCTYQLNGEQIWIWNRFYLCRDQQHAYEWSRAYGGAEPVLHPPHRPDPEFYWHYHTGYSELRLEGDTYVKNH